MRSCAMRCVPAGSNSNGGPAGSVVWYRQPALLARYTRVTSADQNSSSAGLGPDIDDASCPVSRTRVSSSAAASGASIPDILILFYPMVLRDARTICACLCAMSSTSTIRDALAKTRYAAFLLASRRCGRHDDSKTSLDADADADIRRRYSFDSMVMKTREDICSRRLCFGLRLPGCSCNCACTRRTRTC